jgi:transcriptional accessory protein Tex/SPT6
MDQSNHHPRSDEKAQQIVQKLSTYVNAMGHDNGAIVKALMLEHRTIQQQIFETMLVCISAWAQTDHFDLRNEFTVTKSKEIMTLLHGGTRVPYI